MDDQTTTVDPPEGPPGRADRRSVVWTVAAAVAGLGVVVNGASWTGPLSPVIDARGSAGWHGARPALFVAVAVVAGLLTLRWWPWLLLAGSVLSLPLAAPSLAPWYQDQPTAVYLALAGFPLALLAVLAAAQELLHGGTRGLGAALAGGTAGAGLVGAALVGAGFLRTTPGLATWHLLLALLGIAGGVLAVLRARLAPGGSPAAGGSTRPRPAARPTVLGALAALLVFVPVVLTDQRISGLLDVSPGSLYRRPYVVTIIVGLAVLGCAAVLAAACGTWAAAGAAAAALAQVGVVAPMVLALYALAYHPAYGMAAALVGAAVGALAAASRWRVQLAAAAGVGAALMVLVAAAATGGQPEKLIEQARWVPAGLLLALLVAAVTSIVAVAATAAAGRVGLPAVLGPIVGALVVGGKQAVVLLQLRGAEPESSYLSGAHHVGVSAGVLLAAVLTVIGIGVAQTLRARLRDVPAAT